jgi:hypothetical protein
VTSDFGLLGGRPSNPKLLDYLASEFVAHNYSMKWLHRLMLTSDTYQLSSKAEPAQISRNTPVDARNTYLWHFRLQRMAAEPIWDSIHYAADDLDLAVGGKSFQLSTPDQKQRIFLPKEEGDARLNRRGVYMVRGYIPSTDVMNNFLTSFDVDDGRTPCPVRTQTVTAPQALFTMNGELVERESEKLAALVLRESSATSGGGELGLPAHPGTQADVRRTRLLADLHRAGSGADEGTHVAAFQSGRIHLRAVSHERPQ